MNPKAEADLIEAARAGDETSFQRLVSAQRASLRAHCYRMLGSAADADDALQETLLAAWQGIDRFEGRSKFRSWLFTIATHACMRLASRRPKRVTPPQLTAPGDPRADLPEPLLETAWLEPYTYDAAEHDARASVEAQYSECESVELAFVAALQLLPASQRAALILRDVLGFSARETASSLETSEASINSALQRARETVARQTPISQATNRRTIGEETHRRLVADFMGAWQRADVPALVALLAEDATFSMPPLPCWFRGRQDIGVFFAERVFALQWRFVPARANGQAAIAGYQRHEGSSTYRFEVLNVLDLRGQHVASICSFLKEASEPFGLPASIER
ncbi:MAG TPA: RNA polymerase subunit sigma-70 [Polyangiaceae bacterium]|nr:RNA polymerase subunit sigma-70 [Polyangiaceae bacterium]